MMHEEVIIRPMKRNDYAAVRAVWERAGLSVRVGGRDAEPAVRKQLGQWPDTYLVAEADGRIVGVTFGTHDGRKGWINRLAVHPDYRRRGVAGRLVAACEQALHAQGIDIIAALIEGENAASVATVTAAGYEEYGPIRYFRKRWHPGV
jgi:ribosomal protein S18 acetylase RimI-like enzyme